MRIQFTIVAEPKKPVSRVRIHSIVVLVNIFITNTRCGCDWMAKVEGREERGEWSTSSTSR